MRVTDDREVVAPAPVLNNSVSMEGPHKIKRNFPAEIEEFDSASQLDLCRLSF